MIKKAFLIILMTFLFLGCQSVKENLTFKKKQDVDEFLIEKKNPLVVPPEFSKLPKTKTETVDEDIVNNDIDISKVLDNSKKDINNIDSINSSKNLEKSISNILNKK